jgi:hypothetical protein
MAATFQNIFSQWSYLTSYKWPNLEKLLNFGAHLLRNMDKCDRNITSFFSIKLAFSRSYETWTEMGKKWDKLLSGQRDTCGRSSKIRKKRKMNFNKDGDSSKDIFWCPIQALSRLQYSNPTAESFKMQYCTPSWTGKTWTPNLWLPVAMTTRSTRQAV